MTSFVDGGPSPTEASGRDGADGLHYSRPCGVVVLVRRSHSGLNSRAYSHSEKVGLRNARQTIQSVEVHMRLVDKLQVVKACHGGKSLAGARAQDVGLEACRLLIGQVDRRSRKAPGGKLTSEP